MAAKDNQADNSRELKLIIKMNKLFVSFSIWYHGFKLLRGKLYSEDNAVSAKKETLLAGLT